MNNKPNSLALINNSGDLSLYYKDLSKIVMLTPEEEYSLALSVKNERNIPAAQKLIVSYLPLVVKIAYSYKGYGLPMADMISEGNIGLIRAVAKFDPEKGFRLSTYARHWIKAYITDYILNSWSLVKAGTLSGRKKLFFSLNKIKNVLKLDSNNNLTNKDIKAISDYAGVSQNDVIEINNMVSKRDYYLQAPMQTDSSMTFEDNIESLSNDPETEIAIKQEQNYTKEKISEALQLLSEREQTILKKRYLDENTMSLEKLGSLLNISRERVRQIEVAALKKVKDYFVKNKISFSF